MKILINDVRKSRGVTVKLDFEVFLVEGTRNKISSSVPYLLNVEDDTLNYGDAMALHENAFWKKAIDD